MKNTLFVAVLVLTLASLFTLDGCSNSNSTFIEDSNRWVSMPIRENLCPKEAWDILVNSLITKGYQLETSDRDNGFIRSMWFYEVLNDEVLRTRVTVKVVAGETISVRVYPECSGFTGRCTDIPRLHDLVEELRDRLR